MKNSLFDVYCDDNVQSEEMEEDGESSNNKCDMYGSIRFVSLEKVKEPTTTEEMEENEMEWGRENVDGKEEWIIGKGKILTSLTPLCSSDFYFSEVDNVPTVKEEIVTSKTFSNLCIINKELKKVYFF